MSISDQIGELWAAHPEEIGLVWYLLPNQGQPKMAQTAAHLQQQIIDYLLTTPFTAHAGRLVGEQLVQQFRLSLEKLGYLQRLLAEQLFLGLDEAQTAWLAPRLAAFWAEMTVGYGYKLRKLYLAEQTGLPEKLLADLQQAAEGEQQFMALFNATYSPVVLHEYGRILTINQAVTRIFGYTADELIGQEIEALTCTLVPVAEQATVSGNIHQTPGHHAGGSGRLGLAKAGFILSLGKRISPPSKHKFSQPSRVPFPLRSHLVTPTQTVYHYADSTICALSI